MRIAILGTRGIPNNYGGFERFAEVLSVLLTQRGHSVFVSSFNSSKKAETFYCGVHVIPIATPKWFLQNFRMLIYDYRSLKWASKNNFDVILECGHTFSPFIFFFPKSIRKKIIVNPDGLEYYRKKWHFLAKTFLKISERIAVKYSGKVICDNPVLADRIKEKYGVRAIYIPYGAFIPNYVLGNSSSNIFSVIDKPYYLMITRFTPENNLDLIFGAFSKMPDKKLVAVGSAYSDYGNRVVSKYSIYENIKILGAIYDQEKLNLLRYNANAYIHGHSVGGTNPSLLEAMACGCIIIAHDNSFNKYVLNSRGEFFLTGDDLVKSIFNVENLSESQRTILRNFNVDRVLKEFAWDSVVLQYENIFSEVE
ncbi:MAG TPA: DUF1972 domain-containing protein [Tenuifilaceae bacterium]|nr:DUF1972 domain-containing protein [Tenuifilaceae bacterium]